MTRLSLLAFAALYTLSCAARAETLVGTSHTGGRFSLITLGDSLPDEVFGSVYGFDVFGSTPINDMVETEISAGHARRDGSIDGVDAKYRSTYTRTDFRYQFQPGEPINPFVVGGPFLRRNEIDVSTSSAGPLKDLDSNEDLVGLALGGGAEFEITDRVLARAQAGVSCASGDFSIDGSGNVGFWILPQLLGALGATYESESGDIGATLTATWKLP